MTPVDRVHVDYRIGGYVKPLFHGVEAYDPEQDREQGFFHRLWERIADGVAEVLENRPREDVATVADISNPLSRPEASNLQMVLHDSSHVMMQAVDRILALRSRMIEEQIACLPQTYPFGL